jgi:hypothetical protein
MREELARGPLDDRNPAIPDILGAAVIAGILRKNEGFRN